ncbi:hypothetical protein [Halobacteriovorax marinus]|uniref:hypothetical protein n=1 Tax=Halobacteriovorax marinus TaxID=97084 RepID=UPI003A95A588
MKKTFLLCLMIFISACAKHTKKIEPVVAKPAWMATSKLYNDRSQDGEFLIHPFFDLVPFSSKTDNSINFVMTTPIGSLSKYEMDLRSGKLFRTHNFCDQKDVWKKYSGTLSRPPYSEGFIPRLLDQLGTQQKIIVFGKKRYFQKFEITPTKSQRVRVVGGVLLQYCATYPCKGFNRWQSRLLLIGVNPMDPTLSKVRSINHLKTLVDWDEASAFMQNSNGRKLSGSEPMPSYRIIGNIGPKEAFKIALDKGHLFKFKEMKTIRNSCHSLYDYIWKTITAIRNHDKIKAGKAKATSRTRQKIVAKSDTFSGNVIDAERNEVPTEQVEQKALEISDFSIFFKHFYVKYKDRYKTCQKFVRDTSINTNKERMWFFSYLTSFFNTEDSGYIYSCSRKAWMKNPMTSAGTRLYSFNKRMKSCTTSELDMAFDMSINIQSGLSSSFQDHYRFIQYDHGGGGSHQKIYSWVRDKGDGYVCDQERRRELSIFPQDITWKNFGNYVKGSRDIIVQ